MSKPFTDIKITGLVAAATQASPTASGLRLMHLSLSSNPPEMWCKIFDSERQFGRHSMWRRAWVDGGFIVVDCVPEEIEQYHLNDLKQDVTNSNAKYRDYLTQQARQAEISREAAQQERDRIEQIGKRLKFD